MVLPAIRDALVAARRAGVTGIVDVTPYGPVRAYAPLLTDPDLPRIFGCVGFYRKRFIDRRHRELAVPELHEVMARQLARRRAAGLDVACIKVASDGNSLSALEDRIMHAAASFSRHQGLPIVTHAILGRHAQVQALVAGGADPCKIMLSHVEMDLKGTPPRMTPKALASDVAPLLRDGTVLCITDMPVTKSPYKTAIVAFVRELCERGFGEAVCISSDARFTVRDAGLRFGRSRDYTTVPIRLEPTLTSEFDRDTVAALTDANARRFYGITAAPQRVKQPAEL